MTLIFVGSTNASRSSSWEPKLMAEHGNFKKKKKNVILQMK